MGQLEMAFKRNKPITINVSSSVAENVSDDDTEELGGLLTVTRPSQDEEKQRRGADGLDSSSFPVKHLRDWDLEEVKLNFFAWAYLLGFNEIMWYH